MLRCQPPSGESKALVTSKALAAALLASLLAGCVTLQGWSPEETVGPPVPEEPVGPPVPEQLAQKQADSEPPVPAKPAPQPAQPTPLPPEPHIAILLSDDSPAYIGIAAELEALLAGKDYKLYNLDGKLAAAEVAIAEVGEKQNPVVLAIGLHAALLAKELPETPVIFCQVFNYRSHNLVSKYVSGVSSVPPLELQLRAWKELDPNLKSVGAIVGRGHEELISEAERATVEASVELHHRIAHSDRETLYLFKRLVPLVDGFWLFPDNRVLSPAVIDQIFAYAARHNVQIAVFNPSLLQLGAVMSASTVDADVALSVLSVLDRIAAGDLDSVPPLAPLSEVDIQLNEAMLSRLGLAPDGSAVPAEVPLETADVGTP